MFGHTAKLIIRRRFCPSESSRSAELGSYLDGGGGGWVGEGREVIIMDWYGDMGVWDTHYQYIWEVIGRHGS